MMRYKIAVSAPILGLIESFREVREFEILQWQRMQTSVSNMRLSPRSEVFGAEIVTHRF